MSGITLNLSVLKHLQGTLISGMNTLQNGTYRHYKGPLYDVLGLARHSETEEWLVVYRPQYGERGLWVRPLSMFTEMVEYQGRQLPRFEYLGTTDADESIDRI
jgi:hypothetical protein